MTTLTTTDWLARGVIASMLDYETALIETLAVEGDIITVAFVNGMPMPYETFSMLMLYHMAPNAVSQIYARQGLTSNVNSGPFDMAGGANLPMPTVHQQRLYDLIRRENRIPTRYHVEGGFVAAASKAVGELFRNVASSDTNTKASHDNFTKMMTRIEESYASSLLDPQIMSVEAFNFDDDGLVADQF